MGAHFYELFPFRLTSSAWLHSAHVVYGQEERMDGLQIGDLAFNEATNKKKKAISFAQESICVRWDDLPCSFPHTRICCLLQM